jgi:enterobactin synthetase component F
MFDDATLESLALQLGEARSGRHVDHDPMATLLPIRAAGDAAPLFCVHPVSGLAWGYTGLIRHVDPARPIYGLQAFGDAARGEAGPATVAEMAARYRDIIREIQPSGPYNMLGFSFGGLVAHEITRQFEADGETVAFLGLLDSYPYRASTGIGDDAAIVDDEGEIVRAALGFLGLAPDALGQDATMDDLIDHLTKIYDIAGRKIPREVGTPGELIAQLRAVTESNLRLARDHRPGRVAADVLFVRATDRASDAAGAYLDDRPEAWTGHLTGRFDRAEVDCGHQDMLDAAALDRIGPMIAARLAAT